ncbi:hypothetical protein ACPA9J_02140 [Pseudomonas aeruginosa]
MQSDEWSRDRRPGQRAGQARRLAGRAATSGSSLSIALGGSPGRRAMRMSETDALRRSSAPDLLQGGHLSSAQLQLRVAAGGGSARSTPYSAGVDSRCRTTGAGPGRSRWRC